MARHHVVVGQLQLQRPKMYLVDCVVGDVHSHRLKERLKVNCCEGIKVLSVCNTVQTSGTLCSDK